MSDHRVYEGNGRRWEGASLVAGLALAIAAALAVTGQALPQSHGARPAPKPRAIAIAVRQRAPLVVRPNPRPRRRIVVHRRAHPVRAGAVERFARLGVPLFCGGSQARVVALTFDDGPGPYTAQVLALLRRYRARATFFVVGNRIGMWPRIPAAEARLGAVGDHTWSHAFLPQLSASEATTEVVRGRQAVERAVGANVRLFRPPYDGRSAAVERRLRARGMLEVLWSIDPSDYLGRTPSRIVRHIGDRLRPGSIVLLHDSQPRTVEVLRRLLPLLERRRLRPVGIPELLRVDPPSRRLLAAGGPGCWR